MLDTDTVLRFSVIFYVSTLIPFGLFKLYRRSQGRLESGVEARHEAQQAQIRAIHADMNYVLVQIQSGQVIQGELVD